MRFAFGGPADYRTFRGYVFAYGKPTDVRDQAAIDEISKDPTFRRIEDEKEQRQEAAQEVLNPDACPKCGKVLKQGRFMHIKFCKGVE